MEPEIWTYGNMLGYQRKAGRDMHPVLWVEVLTSKSPSWFGEMPGEYKVGMKHVLHVPHASLRKWQRGIAPWADCTMGKKAAQMLQIIKSIPIMSKPPPSHKVYTICIPSRNLLHPWISIVLAWIGCIVLQNLEALDKQPKLLEQSPTSPVGLSSNSWWQRQYLVLKPMFVPRTA